ncbi:9731_t:CDS:2 [Funneliformis mosseae]|uniref:9731_t:CDS:1 n=1 Tax=Funneliformis mosseae TaxID=27381 RepID=A0A9N9AQV7_FUNMO|nr:9731_t:CDS:2 [Funneliformis mosseae]
MNPNIQNRNTIKEKSANNFNTTNTNNATETEQFNEKTYSSQENVINEKQELYQQQEPQHLQHEENHHFANNQFVLDRPVTVSDVLEGKIMLPSPIKRTNKPVILENNNKGSSEIKVRNEKRKLSTTDSMQEFLEIPDYVPGDFEREKEEQNHEQSS